MEKEKEKHEIIESNVCMEWNDRFACKMSTNEITFYIFLGVFCSINFTLI